MPPYPDFNSLKHWKTTMMSAIRFAPDRTDDKAGDWVATAADPRVTFAQLAFVPPDLVRLDRKFSHSLKLNIPSATPVAKDIAAEENSRMTRRVAPLTSTQILRLIYRSLRLTAALQGLNSTAELAAAHWLGDRPADIADYLRLMEEYFEDLQYPPTV